ERGANIGHVPIRQWNQFCCGLAYCCLEARKGKIEPCFAFQRSWQCESLRIALKRHAFNRRATRIRQTEELCRLVEGFAECIINCGAKAFVIANTAHQHHLRMTTGNEQQQIGKWQAVCETCCQCVAFQMVD